MKMNAYSDNCGVIRVEGRADSFELFEGGYRVSSISGGDKLLEAFRLRYRVFSKELGWVGGTGFGMEMDHYDNNAVSIGMYGPDDSLSAYLRIVPAHGRFMLEQVFSHLDGTGRIRKAPDTAEVSRLCISPELRNAYVVNGGNRYGLSMVLIKGLYHWCLDNGIRRLYAVTEVRTVRFYRSLGLPVRCLGVPMLLGGGVHASAVSMDLREFEGVNRYTRPALYRWYQSRSMSPSSEAIEAA